MPTTKDGHPQNEDTKIYITEVDFSEADDFLVMPLTEGLSIETSTPAGPLVDEEAAQPTLPTIAATSSVLEVSDTSRHNEEVPATHEVNHNEASNISISDDRNDNPTKDVAALNTEESQPPSDE